MKFANVILLIAVLFTFCVVSQAQQPAPLWTVDLSAVPQYQDASQIGVKGDFCISFSEPDKVAVAFQFENPSAGSPANALVISLQVATGKLEGVRAWNKLEEFAGPFGKRLVLSPSGSTAGLLAIVGDKIFRLSPRLDILAERSLPLNRVLDDGYPEQDSWNLVADAAAGEAVLVRTPSESTQQDEHWISTTTLQDGVVTPVEDYSLVGIALTGESVIFNLYRSAEPVQIQKRGQPRRSLCASCTGFVNAAFGRGFILLSTSKAPRRSMYSVVDTEGNVIFQESMPPPNNGIDFASGATLANRVAFFRGGLVQGPNGLQAKNRFVVLDADARKEIWQADLIDIGEKKKIGNIIRTGFSTPRLALSPDGHMLAVLLGSTVEMFRVP
jgi:hypothetical protein